MGNAVPVCGPTCGSFCDKDVTESELRVVTARNHGDTAGSFLDDIPEDVKGLGRLTDYDDTPTNSSGDGSAPPITTVFDRAFDTHHNDETTEAQTTFSAVFTQPTRDERDSRSSDAASGAHTILDAVGTQTVRSESTAQDSPADKRAQTTFSTVTPPTRVEGTLDASEISRPLAEKSPLRLAFTVDEVQDEDMVSPSRTTKKRVTISAPEKDAQNLAEQTALNEFLRVNNFRDVNDVKTMRKFFGTSSQESPLHRAVARGYDDMVRILVKNGADTKVVNARKQTPLELAKNQRRRQSNVLRLLR
eukprot:GEMP01041478.1.p1 GENE.GEMP01041478.1~~GEMP01041478.1.p1  ORF type:complete len:304 (+),score=72.45 GEMP01041478.1:93-1004(+)